MAKLYFAMSLTFETKSDTVQIIMLFKVEVSSKLNFVIFRTPLYLMSNCYEIRRNIYDWEKESKYHWVKILIKAQIYLWNKFEIDTIKSQVQSTSKVCCMLLGLIPQTPGFTSKPKKEIGNFFLPFYE